MTAREQSAAIDANKPVGLASGCRRGRRSFNVALAVPGERNGWYRGCGIFAKVSRLLDDPAGSSLPAPAAVGFCNGTATAAGHAQLQGRRRRGRKECPDD
jgi:ribosomal protein L34